MELKDKKFQEVYMETILEKRTYNALEVAAMLGISKSKVYDLIRQGVIPSLKLGSRVVIPKQKFDEWLDN